MTIRLSARQRKRERQDSEHSPGKLAVLKCSFRAVNQSPDNMPKSGHAALSDQLLLRLPAGSCLKSNSNIRFSSNIKKLKGK